MRLRIPSIILLVLLAWAPARAADDAIERLELRVTSTGPGAAVTVDRGRRDGVERGDRVILHPRDGSAREGTVIEVDERSAIVEMHDKRFVPPAGTRGEVLVPGSRRERAPATEKKAPEGVPAHPPWENRDEEFEPGQPLLTGMRPVRPGERRPRLSGRAYAIAEITENVGNYESSLVRVGTDVLYENLFNHGGQFRTNVEFEAFTKQNEQDDIDLLVRWLSYTWGGNRYAETRWEAGRFLQHGMPEFGILDGAEWNRRRDNGHRFGVSLGFLPELDYDFETLSDLQIAGFYEWVSGPREVVTATIGYQKTWHDGEPDRDLFIAKIRTLPVNGWDFHGIVWVDFYTGSDDIKGSGAEITQAIATVARRWKSGSGLNLSYEHWAYPELLRQGEFVPVQAAELARNRNDRLSLDAWWWWRDAVRAHAFAGGWHDEDDTGGAAELGFEVHDFPIPRGRGDITGFASRAQFEDVYGVRGTYGYHADRGYWELMYEISWHHIIDFEDNLDDLVQHRARISTGVYLPSRWNASLYFEATIWDQEFSWTLGITVQKDF